MNKQPFDLEAVSADLAVLLEKHGFTGGYLVAEVKAPDVRMARFCGVVSAQVNGAMPSEFLVSMSKQTFGIVKSISVIDLTTGRN